MLPFLRLGPLLIRIPGLAVLAGLWLAVTAIEKEAKRLKLDSEAIIKTLSYAAAGGLIGARLLYAAAHPAVFLPNLFGLLSLDGGTLDPLAGAVTALLIAFILGQRRGLDLRLTLDAIVPGLAVMAFTIGVAHLLSGEFYGTATTLPWAISLWGQMRHPTQVYELLAAAAVYSAWRMRPEPDAVPGAGFLRWFTLQLAAFVFVQAFRADVALWLGGLRLAQVSAVALMLVGLWLAFRWRRTDPKGFADL